MSESREANFGNVMFYQSMKQPSHCPFNLSVILIELLQQYHIITANIPPLSSAPAPRIVSSTTYTNLNNTDSSDSQSAVNRIPKRWLHTREPFIPASTIVVK